MRDTAEAIAGRLSRARRDLLTPALTADRVPLEVSAWEAPGEPVPAAEALAQRYEPVGPGTPWGRPWSTTWLRIAGTVPEAWTDPSLVDVHVDLGFTTTTPGFQAEGLALSPSGRVLKGVSPRNHTVPLSVIGAAAGERIELFVEAAGNPDLDPHFTFAPTPLGDPETLPRTPLYRLGEIALVRRDPELWGLHHDLIALGGLADELDPASPRRAEVWTALERALDELDPDDVRGTAAEARAALAGVWARPAAASAHRVAAIGHAHIDSAWLWPFRETRRKLTRTYANALALMAEDPDYLFASSSAQHFAWVKEDAPELFERIRQRVAEGRFLPVGGMWVESDTILPGAESMVRQFLEGQEFFQREFGITCREVWLPDSFGYSGALPQIAAGAGARWMLTQKLSWNDTNRMPHHTFSWEGIDGTRVLTHFPPVDNYNCDLSARQLRHAERTFADHGTSDLSLAPSGWGDGGGGPTRDHAEAARRARDLDGLPRVDWRAPADFFAEAEAQLADPAVWVGEMYLEFHRGCYTSQARTKRGNRRSEALLREAELWAATAAVRAGLDYPADELGALWRATLLNQFHDVLPGSSIAWVYADVARTQEDVRQRAEAVIARSVGALVGDAEGTVTLNAGPFPRRGTPALGATVGAAADTRAPVERDGRHLVMRAGGWRVGIDEAGRVASLVEEETGREAVAPGAAFHLALHRDRPNRWDAWDVERSQRWLGRECDAPAEVTVEDDAVVVSRPIGTRSSVVQRFSLTAAGLRIDTTVDWHEHNQLLKYALPLDLRAEHSLAETQFGHVRRATHENTSWEAAKFELPMQRWVHLAEGRWGIGVANDGIHGYDVRRAVRDDRGTTTTVGLSLLRGPRYPDPEADQGVHEFSLLLVPGTDLVGTIRAGYDLHVPPRTVPGSRPVAPLVQVRDEAVLVEAVKLAQDGSGDLIVRLYEHRGERRTARIAVDGAAHAWTTDLLEQPGGRCPDGVGLADGACELTFRPFEVQTLRFRVR
ncbi:MAG: glycoside hydrolase family 38 C-terminal domain-containing protein [Arachnia sp.]